MLRVNQVDNSAIRISQNISSINVDRMQLEKSIFQNRLIDFAANYSNYIAKAKFNISRTNIQNHINALELSLKLAELQFTTLSELLSKCYKTIATSEDQKQDNQKSFNGT